MVRSPRSQLVTVLLVLSCAAPQQEGLDPGPVLSSIEVTPSAVTIGTGDSAVFQVTGRMSDGSTQGVSVTWSATDGSISSSGVYHPGGTAGSYLVIASTGDQAHADTASVTVSSTPVPVTLSSVTVTPSLDSLAPGATRTFSAVGHYSNGAVDTVSIAWTATGGTISSGGAYHAGSTAGSYRVIGTALTAPLADTSVVVIKQAVTLNAVVVTPATATVDPGSTTTFTATGQYSDGSTGPVTVNWTATGGTVTSAGAYTAGGTPGSYRVIASATAASRADTSQVTIRDTTTSSGSVLLAEGFDDASVGPRGWYANTDPAITTTQQRTGSGALEFHWLQGGTTAVKGVSLRHLFTPTGTLYVRYWVKYSSNFVGSAHEFTILTTEDGQWIGPSRSHLGLLMEHYWQNGGAYPRMTAGDAFNIDVNNILVDLSNTTEQRAANGCNGETDGYSTGCYQAGGEWYNQKEWTSATASLTSTAGPSYKNDWHKVEIFFRLNSIANGKGQTDGVAQFRVDGQLKLDEQNVLFRTGAFPNMQFNQIMITGYIGAGSPVDQTMWIDDLIVAPGPVP